MFKPFYVHFNRPVRKTDNSKKRHAPRGFTFYVEPSESNPRNAIISGTFCAAADEFSKKNGRLFAAVACAKGDSRELNKRDLPRILAGCANACAPDYKLVENDYYYILKYMV